MYLARIATDVTVEQVATFARSRLETDDVEVIRLVAKGMDVSTMRNISFKVGVAEAFRSKALSAATWPKGVYFREFENRSVTSKDFASTLNTEKPPENSEQGQTWGSNSSGSSSSGMVTPENQIQASEPHHVVSPMTQ